MMAYDPSNWYWLADDGRVFSSARSMEVPDDDPDYLAFRQMAMPSQWPRDDAGEQTVAELQRVLLPFRVAVDLKAYAFLVRDQKEHGGCPITGVTGVTEVRTDTYTQSLINRYKSAAAGNAAFTVAWILPDRSTVTLDATAINSLFDQTTAFIVGTYNTYSQVITDIDAGTITTTDQIDQAFGTVLQRQLPVEIGWKT